MGAVVGKILEAEPAALRGLAGTLSTVADAIDDIAINDTVTMPGSPVSPATDEATRAVLDAYERLGASVRDMSTACQTTATNYESADSVFADQMHSYESSV